MTSDLKPGLITDSGNFELVKSINRKVTKYDLKS